MINGKLLPLTGQNLKSYLHNLKTNEIESIEIIPHPPAEYEAAGTGGYINIILKKQRESGIEGSINSGYTQGAFPGIDEGFQLNYKKDKLSLFSSYSYSWSKSFEDIRQNRLMNQSIESKIFNNRKLIYKSNRLHVGGSYDLNKNQYIGIDYTGSFSRSNNRYHSVAKMLFPEENNQNDEIVKGNYPNKPSVNFNDIGIQYNLKTDTLGSKLVLLSDYLVNDRKVFNAAHSSFFDKENHFLSDTAYKNITPSHSKIFTINAKYNKVFNDQSTLAFG